MLFASSETFRWMDGSIDRLIDQSSIEVHACAGITLIRLSPLARLARMGSGRDKRKKKPSSTSSAGKGRAKTERKTMKNQAKKERR